MSSLIGIDPDAPSYSQQIIDKVLPEGGGTWNWKTNLKDLGSLLLPNTQKESLSNSLINVGVAPGGTPPPTKPVRRGDLSELFSTGTPGSGPKMLGELEKAMATTPKAKVWKQEPHAKWAGDIHPMFLNEKGEHITSFHATRRGSDFKEFWTYKSKPDFMMESDAFDTGLGSHFAVNEQAMAESFIFHQAAVGEAEQKTIPNRLDEFIFHDSRQRWEEGVGPGVVPVKLRVRNPYIVPQPERGMSEQPFPYNLVWDQEAMAKDVWVQTVGADEEVFHLWASRNSTVYGGGGQFSPARAASYPGYEARKSLWKMLNNRDAVPKKLIEDAQFGWMKKHFEEIVVYGGDAPIPAYGSWWAWHANNRPNPFRGNFFVGDIKDFIYIHDVNGWGYGSSMSAADKRPLLELYAKVLEEQGHDALVYYNTNEIETMYTKNHLAAVIWDPTRIKSPWAKKFDPKSKDFLRGGAAIGAAEWAMQEKEN